MLRDLRLVSVAETFSRLVSLATVPILTNTLVPSEYGIYRSIFVLVSLLLLVRGVLNFSPLLLKRLPELSIRKRRRLIATVTLLFIGLMGLVTLILLAVADMGLLTYIAVDLQRFVDRNPVLVTLFVLLTAVYRYSLTLCKGIDEFGWFSWAKLIHESAFLVAIVGLFQFRFLTMETAVSSYLGAHIIAIMVLAVPLHKELIAAPEFEEFYDSFRHISAPLVPKTLIQKMKTTLPDILILASFSSAIFGAWSVVFAFMTVFQFYSQPFSQVLLPKISKRLSEGQTLERIVHQYYRLMLVLTVPAVVGGWLIGEEIIRYVFGEGYLLSTAVIATIIAAFGIQTINTLAGSFFVATDRSVYATYLQAITTVTLLSFVALGTYVFNSLLLVALGYLLENAVALTLAIGYQRKVINFSRPSPRAISKMVTALLVMVAVVAVFARHINGLVDVFAVTGIGAVAYFTVLTVSGFFTEEDVSLFTRFVGLDGIA